LEGLGPIFSAFGRYLSSRLDLLPSRHCRELAGITDRAEPTPKAIVCEVIAHSTGRPQEEVYSVFEDEPFESRLLFQSHQAVLHNGQAVTVKVVHPELQEYLDCDVEALTVLKHVFTGREGLGPLIEDAIADFRRTLQLQLNLLHEVQTFETLAHVAQDFEMLKVPMVYRDLSTAQVLTREHVPGITLKELGASWEPKEAEYRANSSAGASGEEPLTLVRRLCMVWLWQALLGGQVPVELCPEDVVILPSKQIAWIGGVFASLPSEAKKNLWHYMIATVADDPDKACSYLLREIQRQRQPVDADKLRYRFREVVPFRDGGWSDSGDAGELVECLFMHWKLLSEWGLKLQRHALDFYRGLFQTMTMVHRFAPQSDPLLEGLQDVRTIAMLSQFQEMVELRALRDNLDRYITIFMDFPQKVNEALTLGAERRAQGQCQGMRGGGHHRQSQVSAVVIALLLVLTASVLVSHHLAASAVAEGWVDKISAVVFVVCGALLLWAVRLRH
jgi:predicted unusual protein kinase regulating ubiquinone biosynthesis (AarF/ABC1/UbiB family)